MKGRVRRRYGARLRLRLRLRLIYYGKIDRQGVAARGTRLLGRGLTLLVAGIRCHGATRWYEVYLEQKAALNYSRYNRYQKC
jgi:hypothetical protein